jgi:hypothetical protein
MSSRKDFRDLLKAVVEYSDPYELGRAISRLRYMVSTLTQEQVNEFISENESGWIFDEYGLPIGLCIKSNTDTMHDVINFTFKSS